MSITAYHFWSPTCKPCKAIKPAIEDLKEEFPQIVWLSVNIHDENDVLSGRYNVSVVPTIVIESKDNTGNVINTEKQSGTNMAVYYRSIRNALHIIQQS